MGNVRFSAPRRQLGVVLVAPPYFDVPPKTYGGIEAVVADLADALAAHGHSVVLVGAGQPGTSARFVPVWDHIVPELLGQAYPELMHAAAVRRAIEQLVVTDHVDIVHDHTLSGPLNASAYAALGLPTVATVHTLNDDFYRYFRTLGKDLQLVAVSNRQRVIAPELNWIGTVHNALRVDDWPFQAQKEDYALFLSRFHPEKAPHLALDAAHAAGVPLVLAGKCIEPVEKEYFEREVRPRLTERDRLFGLLDAQTKRKLLAGARCLLFPIVWEEPFGMVLLEAMACGTPVVALRAGAVPEVVIDGVTGLICDEPDEMVGALADVRSIDPAACRAHVAEHFGVETFCAGYEAAYLRALEPSEPAGVGTASPLGTLRGDYATLDFTLDEHERTNRP